MIIIVYHWCNIDVFNRYFYFIHLLTLNFSYKNIVCIFTNCSHTSLLKITNKKSISISPTMVTSLKLITTINNYSTHTSQEIPSIKRRLICILILKTLTNQGLNFIFDWNTFAVQTRGTTRTLEYRPLLLMSSIQALSHRQIFHTIVYS